MGVIVKGKWNVVEPQTLGKTTPFSNWVTKDGGNGPDGQKGYKADKDRYHLYLNLGCPFAHRAHIAHALKGLDNIIDLSIVNPGPTEYGWSFAKTLPRTTGDKLFPEHKHIYEVYVKSDPEATARASVPVLFDTKTNTIVSAESADIVRQFSGAFDAFGAKPGNFYPQSLAKQIDEANQWVQDNVGSVFIGFKSPDKSKQEQTAVTLSKSFDALNERFAKNRWYNGDQLTETDIRLFVTVLRTFAFAKLFGFPPASKWPNLFEWLKDFYQLPGVSNTVELEHIYKIFLGDDLKGGTVAVPTPQDIGLTDPVNRKV